MTGPRATISEAELGAAWAQMAAREGHRKGTPQPPYARSAPAGREERAHTLRHQIAALIESGHDTPAEIKKRLPGVPTRAIAAHLRALM